MKYLKLEILFFMLWSLRDVIIFLSIIYFLSTDKKKVFKNRFNLKILANV